MKTIVLALLLTASLAIVGCSGLDGYKRTYSANYTSPQGQSVGVGVTFDPTKSGK